MKPSASPLTIVDFAIMSLNFNFIAPESETNIDFKKSFKDYQLDIDFGINSDEIIKVLIKAEINYKGNKLPGYSIAAEAACIFEFNEDIKINEETKNSIEGFATIYIALNALRGFISQITANGPLGRYIMPSVDLNDLISQKKLSLRNKQASKSLNKIVKKTKKEVNERNKGK